MNHYLYRYIRLDKNVPFYVGVGTKREGVHFMTHTYEYSRAFNEYKRSDWWKNITNKTDYEVEIMMESDDYDFILEKEQEFIKLYGRRDLGNGTLVNMTDGGEGCLNGHYHTQPVLQYTKEGKFIGEWESMTEAKEMFEITSCLSRICKEEGKTAGDYQWKYKESDNYPTKIPPVSKHKGKEILQYTKKGVFVKEWERVIDASRELNILRTTISGCLSGGKKTAGGFMWRFKDGEVSDKIKPYKKKMTQERKVIQMTLDGDVINTFDSHGQASKETGVCRSTISSCCRGENKTAGGFKWKNY